MQGFVRSEEENKGSSGGRKFIYEVTDDPADVINATEKSDYSNALPDNVWDILKHHKEDEATSFDAPDPGNKAQRQIWNFT